MEHNGDADTNCNLCTLNCPQRLGKGTEKVGNRRTTLDPLNYSIIKIGQNTEKSPGDPRKLAIIPTRVKDNQLTLVRKKSQGVI